MLSATNVRFSLACVVSVAVVLWTAALAPAQDSNASVEQARLFPRTTPPTPALMTADGTALPASDPSNPDDDSFGAQQILKQEQKTAPFAVTGSASLFYTSNVALTRRDELSDGFFVANAGFLWTPQINPEWLLQFNAGASIFRYFDTTELDFESLGFGLGAIWAPKNAWGVTLIGRYDFAELIDSHSHEILQDHQFSMTLQKTFVLGRSHALSLALIGSAGISDPFSEQRDQVGLSAGYHLRLTRQLDSDFGYRLSGYFYNDGGRNDLNQVFSCALHYRITPWATVDAFISGATNDSNHSAFEYNVFSTGGGAGLTIRF